MLSPTRPLATRSAAPLVLAIVAGASGIWAMAQLSDDGRQNLLLGATAATLAGIVLSAGRNNSSPRTMAGAMFLGAAAGLAVGIDALAIDVDRVDSVVWLGAICALFAIAPNSAATLFGASSALILVMVVALGAVSNPTAPSAGVQVLAAGGAVLALTIGVSVASTSQVVVPAGLLFLAGALTSTVAAARVERIWTTSTLVLLTSGYVLVFIAVRPLERGAQLAFGRFGDADRSVLELVGAVTGSAAIVLAALDRTTLGWPVAGAVGAGLCGLGIWRYEHERAHMNRQLYLERAALESRKDPLTQLNNRRGIEERLAQEIARAQRFGHPLSALMIDIDDFKLLNDRYGHTEGDRALRQLGSEIERSIRSIDAAGRFGGEEFLVLLPETRLEGALTVAERIRDAAEATDTSTISIGVSDLDREIGSANELIAAADAALYCAKRSGKNRVESAS